MSSVDCGNVSLGGLLCCMQVTGGMSQPAVSSLVCLYMVLDGLLVCVNVMRIFRVSWMNRRLIVLCRVGNRVRGSNDVRMSWGRMNWHVSWMTCRHGVLWRRKVLRSMHRSRVTRWNGMRVCWNVFRNMSGCWVTNGLRMRWNMSRRGSGRVCRRSPAIPMMGMRRHILADPVVTSKWRPRDSE